jgi:hypothetical protein
MTPEHRFQLLLAVLTITPATIVSAWALLNQRAQTKPRLQVILALKPLKNPIDADGLNQCPDVIVRNLSPFPLTIRTIGYRIKNEYPFVPALVVRDSMPRLSELPWPYQIEPRTQAIFGFNPDRTDAIAQLAPIIAETRKKDWRNLRAYVVTDCNARFESRRMIQI